MPRGKGIEQFEDVEAKDRKSKGAWFDHSKSKKTEKISSSEKSFNKDFDDSLEFFSSLAKKPENLDNKQHNKTFKNYPDINSVLLQRNAFNIASFKRFSICAPDRPSVISTKFKISIVVAS